MSVRRAIATARCTGGAALLLFMPTLVIALLSGPVVDLLQYDRARVAAGEVYRLLTCHWTHWSADHLIWDAAAFGALAFGCEGRGRRRFLATLIIAAIIVPLGLFVFQPEMAHYRGLSALASALFALLAVDVVQERAAAGQWAWVIAITAVGCGFVAKIWIEMHYGATVFVENHAADFVPVPLAHLLGAAVGAAMAAVHRPSTMRTPVGRVVETLST